MLSAFLIIKKTAKKRTRAVGIEPTLKVLETLVLPLNYARIIWKERDSNPRTRRSGFTVRRV